MSTFYWDVLKMMSIEVGTILFRPNAVFVTLFDLTLFKVEIITSLLVPIS